MQTQFVRRSKSWRATYGRENVFEEICYPTKSAHEMVRNKTKARAMDQFSQSIDNYDLIINTKTTENEDKGAQLSDDLPPMACNLLMLNNLPSKQHLIVNSVLWT